MALIPLTCQWIFRDELGDTLTRVEFDSIEHLADPEEVDLTSPHMGVAALLPGGGFTITADVWRSSVSDVEAFVERAFGERKNGWPRAIDDSLTVVYSMGGTRVRVRALQGGDSFDRTIDYLEPGGVPSVDLGNWQASGPMRVWSWVVFHDSVDALIKLNGADGPNRLPPLTAAEWAP